MLDAVAFLAVFAVTVALTPLLMRRAEYWRLVALPDARKLHDGAVPVVGGLAMGIAFLGTYIATLTPEHGPRSLAIAAAAAITLAGGVLDDRHELRASMKFGFQILAAALLAVWGEALLTHVGRLTSEDLFTLGRFSLALTIFAIVGVMNAINMADGLDGLAGSLALAACLAFGFAAVSGGDGVMFTAICLTAGAVTGFLVHNARSPWRGAARVYMGDTGSLLLGLLLAWFAIRLAMSDRPALAPITAVWILAIPIGDTVTLMVRRALRGRSPFRADREHLHHILLALGLSSGHVVLALFAASLALGAIALAAERGGVPEYVMFYAYMAGLVAHAVAAEALCRKLALRNGKGREASSP